MKLMLIHARLGGYRQTNKQTIKQTRTEMKSVCKSLICILVGSTLYDKYNKRRGLAAMAGGAH